MENVFKLRQEYYLMIIFISQKCRLQANPLKLKHLNFYSSV